MVETQIKEVNPRNLQRKIFREQDLSGVDFSNADIRGADFTGSTLRRTNFTGALAGIPDNRLAILITLSSSLAVITSLPFFAYVFARAFAYLSTLSLNVSATANSDAMVMLTVDIFNLLNFIVILVGICTRGINLKTLRDVILVIVALDIAQAGLQSIPTVSSISHNIFANYGPFFSNLILYSSVFFTWLLMNIVTTFLFSVAVIGMGILTAVPFFISFSSKNKCFDAHDLAKFIAKNTFHLLLAAVLVAPTGKFFFSNLNFPGTASDLFRQLFSSDMSLKLIIVVVTYLLIQLSAGYYIAMKALQQDERFVILKNLLLGILSRHGTRFTGTDLTEADFSSASVKISDFRKARLLRTKWLNSHWLRLNQFSSDSNLTDPQILHLVTTLSGENHDFSQKRLNGLNLRYANLKNANLLGADLCDSDLRDTDLFA